MDRLRQRADFLAAATGSRAGTAAFTLQHRRRDDSGPVRFGLTVSRKVGTATERNRVRRRLRNLINRIDPLSLPDHSDYVLVGRREALHRTFDGMLNDLRGAVERVARNPRRAGTGDDAKRRKATRPQGPTPQTPHDRNGTA